MTLAPFRPLKVVVETSPFWPWIREGLVAEGIESVLAHAKGLRVIAESDHKSDAIDAELLARMLQAGLIPEAHVRSGERREQLRLVRHRATLVRAVVSHRQNTPESTLSTYDRRQKKRLGWLTARVATARKLCRAVYAMPRTGEPWCR